MGNEIKGKVIKPPVGIMSSGKVFRPSKKFRNKLWFVGLFIAVMFWIFVNLGYFGIGYLVVRGGGTTMAELEKYWMPVNQVVWIIHLIWLIPLVILSVLYVNRIEYSVLSRESGEAMPEIYVKKGLINITRKHVPFRTITNISSRAGPFDRLFGIGTVEIETAGFSGPKSGAFGGPEEKIEGIVFYEEVRDFILTELRKYRAPYTTTTEAVYPHAEAAPQRGDFDEEILRTLNEIRDILKSQQK